MSSSKPILQKVTVQKQGVKVVPQKTNHILVIDCSGSMSYDLPKMRTQLKNKIPTMVNEGDTVSLIWFSGKGEYGTLAEKIVINGLTDLEHLNKAIDRWLKPVGMTGFVEPLQSAVSLAVGRGDDDDVPASLFFLTDGYDNQWDTETILKTAGQISGCVSSAVIVEYGWNCNRSLLTKMAEAMEGTLVFCEDFDRYDPILASVLKKSLNSIKKVEVKVGTPKFGLVFSKSDVGPVTYTVKSGCVEVPETVEAIYFYSDDLSNDVFDKETSAVLQSVVLLSRAMESGFIKRVLARLQYVELFNKFSTSFGKQNITDFQVLCTNLSNDLSGLDAFEKSSDIKVDPNAFTVLDLLFILAKDKDNLLMTDKMIYHSIGRGREDASDTVSGDELKELQEALANVKDTAGLEALQARIASIKADKAPKLEFKANETEGYSIANLTWNEKRPNVSVLVRKEGTIELPADKATQFGLPQKFPTYIYRNYTIIADGIVNVDILPVKLTIRTVQELYTKWPWFAKECMNTKTKKLLVFSLPIRSLATLNENMVTKVSAKNFIELSHKKCQLKAEEKAIKYFKERWFGKKVSADFLSKYTSDAVDYLTSLGITSFNGFSPKVKLADKTGDFYMAVELISSIPGLSKVPSMNEYFKAVEASAKSGKKLNVGNSLFVEAYEKGMDLEEEAKFVVVKEQTQKTLDFLEGAIQGWSEAVAEQMEKIENECIQIMFSIVVGQTWFKEFASLSENEVMVNLNKEEIPCKVQLKDVQVDL